MPHQPHRCRIVLVAALVCAFPQRDCSVHGPRDFHGAPSVAAQAPTAELFSGRVTRPLRQLPPCEPASIQSCRLAGGDHGEPATIVPTQFVDGNDAPEQWIVAAAQRDERLPPGEPPPQPLEAETLSPGSPAHKAPASGAVKLTPIGQLSADIVPAIGELPHDYAAAALGTATGEPTVNLAPIRTGAPFYSTPRAADLTHRPLYFEERALERHGRNYGLAQPVVSGLHFFGTLPVLPYKMGAQPPSRRITTGNGVDIPGDQLSRRDRLRGLATEAGTATGLILVIP